MREDEPWLPWEIDPRQARGAAEFFYSVLARMPGALPSTTEAISSRVGFLVLPKRALHAAELRRGREPAPPGWWPAPCALGMILKHPKARYRRLPTHDLSRLGCRNLSLCSGPRCFWFAACVDH